MFVFAHLHVELHCFQADVIAQLQLKPVSLYMQARAVFLHNTCLLLRQKKANVGRLVLLGFVMLISALSATEVSSRTVSTIGALTSLSPF